MVRKTSVYLSDEDRRRLATLAKRERTSQAQVIRRAIASYVPRRVEGGGGFALARSGEGPGGSIADVPEDELVEGFGS